MARSDIVVGTDGTMAGAAAVRWAATEAARRNVLLRIVHCFDWDDSSRQRCGGGPADAARYVADSVTTAALHQARAAAPGIWIEADALIGDAAAHLVELSGAVALVVVGSRGRGGLAGLLLGSVSRRVVVHAECPVVVVRGRADSGDGPVVAGVDLSPRGETVLRQAYETAAALKCPLHVVHSYSPAVSPWVGAVPSAVLAAPIQDEAERDRLYTLLTPWRDKYAHIATTVGLSHQPAASALSTASAGARLLVVGSHGHGAVASTLLGSTSLYLLHHAGCPVLAVRTR